MNTDPDGNGVGLTTLVSISEVKQRRIRLVLGWVTIIDYRVWPSESSRCMCSKSFDWVLWCGSSVVGEFIIVTRYEAMQSVHYSSLPYMQSSYGIGLVRLATSFVCTATRITRSRFPSYSRRYVTDWVTGLSHLGCFGRR